MHLAAIYWAQSLVIGVANIFRILSLDRFSTEFFTSHGVPVHPTPETKWRVAAQFAMGYGILHAIYFLLLLVGHMVSGGVYDPLFGIWFWAATFAFALNHIWSYLYNRALDERGTPEIVTLMWTPYLRIVPMHLTLFLGVALDPRGGLLLFGALKTAADVVMHLVQHAQLQQVRNEPVRGRN